PISPRKTVCVACSACRSPEPATRAPDTMHGARLTFAERDRSNSPHSPVSRSGAFASAPPPVLTEGPADSPAPGPKRPLMSESWRATLNPEQRRAVEHEARPLLIIAGAGSGKPNTLAHRVANLIVRGADPRRILLLTFSRRAAAEMTRRVERITARALADRAGLVGGLAWSGTFHAIRARLLREYAPAIRP